MRKTKLLAFILLVLGIILLLMSNLYLIFRTFSIFLGEPDYLIVTADKFYNTEPLQKLINYIQNKGFTVETKTMNQLKQQFPLSPPSYELLKIHRINNVTQSFIHGTVIFYFINNETFDYFGYYDGNQQKYFQVHTSPIPTETFIYINYVTWKNEYIYINYDDNKTLTITLDANIPPYYYCWGYPFITTDGKIYFNETEGYHIWKYVKSHKYTVKYLLLVGDNELVPGIPYRSVRYTENGYIKYLTENSFTDYLYSVIDEQPYYLPPSISVGRIPASSVSELEIYVNKIVNFIPKSASRSLLVVGDPCGTDSELWFETYENIKNSVNITETQPLNELKIPTLSEFITELNKGNNYVVVFAHGNERYIYLTRTEFFTTSDLDAVQFKSYTLIYLISCGTGKYSGSDCIAERFLLDSDSNTVFVIAPCTVSIAEHELIKRFFNFLTIYGSAGEALKQAKNDLYSLRLCFEFQLFGEPSTYLVTPEAQPEPNGILRLAFTIDGNFVDDIANYTVRYPNGTLKYYVGTNITLLNCPIGEYYINCTYQNVTKTQIVEVYDGQTTSIVFNFVSPKLTGSLTVTSNVELIVVIQGERINITRTTPCIITGLPLGTYVIKAYYNEELVDEKIITLTESEDSKLVEFNVETYYPHSSLYDTINKYLPFILILFAIILIIKL